jgi:hypothetical protein
VKYLNPFKLFENLQQAKSILKRLDIPETDRTFIKIKDMFLGNTFQERIEDNMRSQVIIGKCQI